MAQPPSRPVHLRNCLPSVRVAVPLPSGSARVVWPQATSMVPASVTVDPFVRRLTAGGVLTEIDPSPG